MPYDNKLIVISQYLKIRLINQNLLIFLSLLLALIRIYTKIFYRNHSFINLIQTSAEVSRKHSVVNTNSASVNIWPTQT